MRCRYLERKSAFGCWKEVSSQRHGWHRALGKRVNSFHAPYGELVGWWVRLSGHGLYEGNRSSPHNLTAIQHPGTYFWSLNRLPMEECPDRSAHGGCESCHHEMGAC